jgi:hypothetical protein
LRRDWVGIPPESAARFSRGVFECDPLWIVSVAPVDPGHARFDHARVDFRLRVVYNAHEAAVAILVMDKHRNRTVGNALRLPFFSERVFGNDIYQAKGATKVLSKVDGRD